MDLDIRTLIVMLAIAIACSAFLISIVHKLRFSVQGTLFWAYGCFMAACALILTAFRGILPDFITIVIANTVIVYNYGLIWSGTRIFLQRSSLLQITLTTPLVISPFLFWYSEVSPSLKVRTLLVFTMIIIFSTTIAYELLKTSKETNGIAQRFTGYVFASNALFLLVLFTPMVLGYHNEFYLKSGGLPVGLYLWSFIFVFGATFGMIMMISEKLEEGLRRAETNLHIEKQNLQKTLSEVKTLRGFLPICSYCRKIRDDKGYWNQIESYIHEHSDTEFSHGICPECSKKLYPDMDLYGDEKTR
jgi:hypothetical protein